MFARVVSLAVVCTLAGGILAEDPPKGGKVTWAKGYPKAGAAGKDGTGSVEFQGEYTTGTGWKVKEARLDHVPKAGGVAGEPTKVMLSDGKWGGADDKGKIVPGKVSIKKGEWNVRVVVVYEGTDAKGQPTTIESQTSWESVEVK